MPATTQRGGWSLRQTLRKYRNRPNSLRELAERVRLPGSHRPKGHGDDSDLDMGFTSLFDAPADGEITYRPKRQFVNSMWHDNKSPKIKSSRSYEWRGGKKVIIRKVIDVRQENRAAGNPAGSARTSHGESPLPVPNHFPVHVLHVCAGKLIIKIFDCTLVSNHFPE